jgi:hypothetical protein
LVEDASQDQIMLLARTFAEQGLMPLFERMLALICKHQDKAQTVRLRGQWVEIDPSTWSTQMDMSVAVGLGTGSRAQQVAQLMTMITQVDAPIVQAQGGLKGPLITGENAYRKLLKLAEAMGFKTSDGFYADPAAAPPPAPVQPPADSGQQMAQAQLAITKAQADMQMALKREDAALKAALAREKLNHAIAMETLKTKHAIELDKMRAAADNDIARQKAEMRSAEPENS